MHTKNLILTALIILLVVSVIGELIALYTSQFIDNKIPFTTHFYNFVLVGFILLYSIEPKEKHRIKYLPLNAKIKDNINKQAEKYYIHHKNKDYTNVPDTQEIWITPSAMKKFSDTLDFDETTIQYIKQQRYKSAALHLNEKDVK